MPQMLESARVMVGEAKVAKTMEGEGENGRKNEGGNGEEVDGEGGRELHRP